MKQRFSNSFRDLLHYLLSGGVTRLLPFILLPYIAHVLNSQDFGLYTLYRLYITLGATLLLLGLEQAIFRFIPQYSDDYGYKALGTALYFIMLISGIIFLVSLSANRFLNTLFFETNNRFPFYYVPLFILLNATSTLLITFFSARRQSKDYLRTNVIGQLSFFLFFLIGLYLGLGLTAFFYAIILSNGLIFLMNLKYWKLAFLGGFDYPLLRRLLEIGFPLMLVTLITYLLYQSDHYIIKYFLGLKMTGIYNYGYRFGAVILIFVTITNNVWLPRVYGNGETFLIKNLKSYSGLITVSTTSIFWLIVLIFHIFPSVLIPKGFEASLTILNIVGLSYIIYGHVHTIDAWLILKNRNSDLVRISAVGLLINIGLNIFFIPRFGIVSAAIITGFSFLLIWIILLFYLRRFISDTYLRSIFFKVLLLALPGLLLFVKLPFWVGFITFLAVASWELHSNALLPQLLKKPFKPQNGNSKQ